MLLLLAGALRLAARAYRDTPLGSALFQMLGGDRPQRAGAYIATSAIGLAFVLSLIGFILFAGQFGLSPITRNLKSPRSTKQQRTSTMPGPARRAWPGLSYGLQPGTPAPPATVLTLGYRIDSLAAVMFMMVTFIATMIHIFSIGYMADELEPIVEDHQVHTESGPLHRRGRFGRFFLFLSLFCFSMLNLVRPITCSRSF